MKNKSNAVYFKGTVQNVKPFPEDSDDPTRLRIGVKLDDGQDIPADDSNAQRGWLNYTIFVDDERAPARMEEATVTFNEDENRFTVEHGTPVRVLYRPDIPEAYKRVKGLYRVTDSK